MSIRDNQNITSLVQGIVADAIQVPVDLVSEDLAFGDLPQWDSLGHMEVMLKLESEFGINIDAEAIAVLISIPEICRFLEENGHVG
jgi:acyl carrier protein